MDLFFLFAVTEIKLEEVIKTIIVSLVFLVCSSLVLSKCALFKLIFPHFISISIAKLIVTKHRKSEAFPIFE